MAVQQRTTLKPYERVRNFLFRRDYLRVPYRILRTRAQRRELTSSVTDIPSVSQQRFRELEGSGLFHDVRLTGLTPAERELIRHVSFTNYFHIQWTGDDCVITDHHVDTPYAQRQAMLATVYEHIGD